MAWTADRWIGVVGIALGVVAIIMAVSPFLQLWFGRPDFDLDIDEFTGPDGKSLFMTLRNKSTRNWLLRRLGVVREIGDVDGSFNIRRLGSNEMVAHLVSGSLHNAVLRESGLMVRAHPGRTIGMTVINFAGGHAYITDARAENLPVIAAGDYIVDGAFICSERIFRISSNLRIGPTPQQTHWY